MLQVRQRLHQKEQSLQPPEISVWKEAKVHFFDNVKMFLAMNKIKIVFFSPILFLTQVSLPFLPVLHKAFFQRQVAHQKTTPSREGLRH